MNPSSWKILNLDPSASIEQVRKHFRKLALKYHPDKGGSPFIFQQLKDAYKDILTFHTNLNQKNYMELRSGYNNRQVDEQTNNTSNLDTIDKFNRFFLQHRIDDPLENGYGHLMEKSNIRDDESMLAKTKIKHFADQQLVVYQAPEEVFNCSSSIGKLGDDNSNFTSAWNQKLKYTDYLEAHSKPVDRNIIPIRKEYNSLEELQMNREKSLKATRDEEKKYKKLLKKQEKEELYRMKRLNQQDTRIQKNYEKIQNLLKY
jgi:curved DNA-binding protein CbpA